jgi:hypothetical protein
MFYKISVRNGITRSFSLVGQGRKWHEKDCYGKKKKKESKEVSRQEQ